MKKNDDLILYIYRKKDDWYCWKIQRLGPSATPLGEDRASGVAATYDAASEAGHLVLEKIKQKNKGENK